MADFMTIGIAGHVDHGKTRLVRALTGIDTDRLRLEKERGVSIESGIANMQTPDATEISLVDVPGHTDFMKNTIRGLSGVDAAILLVAADDGVMPQTVEHFEILKFLGLKNGFIVLSKADLVDPETLELAELEIRDLTQGSFLEGAPVIPFSIMDGRGLEPVRQCISEVAQNTPPKDRKAPFRLWVDRIQSFTGFGTVASGTVHTGTLRQGDALEILSSGIDTRARSLEVHHRRVSGAVAGQRVGINLQRVPLKALERGMVLAEPNTAPPCSLLNAHLQVLKGIKRPIKNGQRVKLFIGTAVVNTRIILMEQAELTAGQGDLVQFRLMKPVAARPQDPFVICLLNTPTILGGGKILEAPAEKYRAAKSSTMRPYLKAILERDITGLVEYALRSVPNRPVTAGELAKRTGLEEPAIKEQMAAGVGRKTFIDFREAGVFKRDRYLKVKADVLKAVEGTLAKDPLKTALTPDEIRKKLALSMDDAPVQRMLVELTNEGRLLKIDRGYRSRDISKDLSEAHEALIGFCLDYARRSKLVPFSADTIWKRHEKKIDKNEIKRILDYLFSENKLIRLNDRRFLTPEAVEEIKSRVKNRILQKGGLTLADSKEALGYGRSVGVPVLEYLDAIGFTRREGDKRILISENG